MLICLGLALNHYFTTMSAKMTTFLLLLLCFFGLGNAELCASDSDCSGISEAHFCCSDHVCRQTCCLNDLDCSTGKMCCPNGDCRDFHDSCPLTSTSVLVGSVVGSVVFFVIFVGLVACCCCAGCPWYWRQSSVAAIVAQPNPYQQFVSTSTTMSQQAVQPYYPSHPTIPTPQQTPKVAYPV